MKTKVYALISWLAFAGCSDDPAADVVDWTPLPPMSTPTDDVRAAHLGDEATRASTPFAALDACQRRSQVRIDDAWTRILLDFDPARGQRRRTKPGRTADPHGKPPPRPFVPVVGHTLAPCRTLLTHAEGSWPPALTEALRTYVQHGEIAVALMDALAEVTASRAPDDPDRTTIEALAQQVMPTLALAMERFDASTKVLREHTSRALAEAETNALATLGSRPELAFQRHALALVHGGRAVDACLREREDERPCRELVTRANTLVRALEAHCEANPEHAFWATAVRRSARDYGRTLTQAHDALVRRELKDPERTAVLTAFDRLALATDETLAPLQRTPATSM